jgi:integrase
MERDGFLLFSETKGRKRTLKSRELQILPELRAIIDATPSGHLNYLVTSFGKPFTANGFGNWFRRRCNEAGLPHCSAHGLRKAGAVIAAENGATERQLMAIYGWRSSKMAAHYTEAANQKKMAADAMHLIVPSLPPTPLISSSGRFKGKKS